MVEAARHKRVRFHAMGRAALPAVVFAFALILALSLLRQLRPDIALDDAPITYRYAVNLAEGKGFTYNPGERVLGTSTPLYTVILAGFELLEKPPEVVSPVIGLLAFAGSVVLSFAVAQQLVTGSGYLVVLLVASSGFLMVHSTSGMETSLYCFTILLAIWAYIRGWKLAAFATAAICFLLRLDGLAVVLALSAAEVLSTRRLPWREGLLFLTIVAPWLIFATAYFGSPIPLSWMAKRTHTIPEPYWMIKFLVQDRVIFYVVLATFALPALLTPDARWRWPRTVALPIWLAGYVVAYSLAGIERYDWYLSPVYLALYILAGAGLWRVLRWLWESHRVWALPGIAIALVVVGGMTRNASLGELESTRKHLVTVELARMDTGIWLRNHTAKDAIIGTNFIGHVGYQSDRYIYDYAGLVTQEVVQERSSGEPHEPELTPDYVVIPERFLSVAEGVVVYESQPRSFVVMQPR